MVVLQTVRSRIVCVDQQLATNSNDSVTDRSHPDPALASHSRTCRRKWMISADAPLSQFLLAGILLIIRDPNGNETKRLALEKGSRVEIVENTSLQTPSDPLKQSSSKPPNVNSLELVDDQPSGRFTVFAPTYEPTATRLLTEMMTSVNKPDSVHVIDKLSDIGADDRDVVLLVMDSKAFLEIGDYDPQNLKQRKVIGIGYGAAKLFGELGLEINGGACAHGVQGPPRISMEPNRLIVESRVPAPLFVFEPPVIDAEHYHNDLFFGMYIGDKKPMRRDLVDIISLQTADKKYAPIVRQGVKVLICVDAPADQWSKPFRQLVNEIAIALDSHRPK
ncbi:hypothetical protein [Bythopirellula polymerisocia]|uniref:Uncharacterized protein n=1 Tax=Bythopirellula polymerisocia TaxID=2528003 RepID=A0A5C6CY47_9BACT|nr:hypothetical protein [Bythopirellula polymerisocia]TWU29490.1 hypothetical protein Pla144_02680 [Bythopirellula polymerisocia]